MPRHLRRQRRDRASCPRRIAVLRAQIGANQDLDISSVERLLEFLMPSVKRPKEGFSKQRLLRLEVGVERANGQAGLGDRGPPKDTDEGVRLVGCAAHLRRYFFEAA